jgi:hypothetical protein
LGYPTSTPGTHRDTGREWRCAAIAAVSVSGVPLERGGTPKARALCEGAAEAYHRKGRSGVDPDSPFPQGGVRWAGRD